MLLIWSTWSNIQHFKIIFVQSNAIYLNWRKKSKLKLIELGVPQGSILGPLLFIIYMNDLSLSEKKLNVILCADDTVVKSRSSASKIDDDHDKALINVNDWLIKIN